MQIGKLWIKVSSFYKFSPWKWHVRRYGMFTWPSRIPTGWIVMADLGKFDVYVAWDWNHNDDEIRGVVRK